MSAVKKAGSYKVECLSCGSVFNNDFKSSMKKKFIMANM